MNGEEKIKQLEDSIELLQQQLEEQQQQVDLLTRQVEILSAKRGLIFVKKKQPVATETDWSTENFIGLRLINLVGIVVLVIGLSIGVKYAIDRNLISESARIFLAYSAAIALFLLSVRLHKNYLVFSAILFSGSMASLYFTTYAAYSYYNMLPFAMAFAIMLVLTVFTSYEAIIYNRQEIALLGLVGAYAIPFLISKNEERADLFFSYIFIINVAVVYLGYRKNWLTVSRLAQLVTWVLFAGWVMMREQQNYFSTGVIFLIAFFLLFTVSVLINRIVERRPLAHPQAYQQLFNNLAAYLAAIFLFAFDFYQRDLAVVTASFALLAAIQTYLFYHYFENETLLRTLHVVLAVALSILYVVFEWEGFIVTVIWMLMAIALFLAGFRIRSVALRLASIGLMGLTLVKLLLFDSATFSPVEKVIAYVSLGILLLVTSFFYQKFREKIFER